MSLLPQPSTAALPFPSERQLRGMVRPEQVLDWALDAYPRTVLATSLGPQTLVVIDLLHRMHRDAASHPPILFVNTGLHFAETLQLLDQVEQRYGVEIVHVKPRLSLSEQARNHGPQLWRREPNRCCSLRKVTPLRQVLADQDAWITGLRRDQSSTRAQTQPIEWDDANGLVKINPLFNWTREQVFEHLDTHRLPYNSLLTAGYRSVGCSPCTSPVDDSVDERAGRWSDSGKTECGIHVLFSTDSTQD